MRKQHHKIARVRVIPINDTRRHQRSLLFLENAQTRFRTGRHNERIVLSEISVSRIAGQQIFLNQQRLQRIRDIHTRRAAVVAAHQHLSVLVRKS